MGPRRQYVPGSGGDSPAGLRTRRILEPDLQRLPPARPVLAGPTSLAAGTACLIPQDSSAIGAIGRCGEILTISSVDTTVCSAKAPYRVMMSIVGTAVSFPQMREDDFHRSRAHGVPHAVCGH